MAAVATGLRPRAGGRPGKPSVAGRLKLTSFERASSDPRRPQPTSISPHPNPTSVPTVWPHFPVCPHSRAHPWHRQPTAI